MPRLRTTGPLLAPILATALASASCATAPSVGTAPAPSVSVHAAAYAEPAAGPAEASAGAPAASVLDDAVVSGDLASPDARTSAPQGSSPAPGDRWTLTAAPYVWLFDIDGSISKDGHSVPVSMHLQDSWDLVKDHGELCLAGHFEAQRGDWTLFFDANVLSFEGEGSVSREIQDDLGTVDAEFDTTLDIRMFELGAAWHAGDLPIEGCRGVPIEVLGGVRWNSLDVDVDIDVAAAGPSQTFERSYGPDVNESWADPFVGLRTRLELTENVGLVLRGDVGGGLGEGADFAWNVVALLGFRISESATAFAGWRWYEFERDSHGREVELQLEGPGIGVEFRF